MNIPDGKHKGKRLRGLNYYQLYLMEKAWSGSHRLQGHPFLKEIRLELLNRVEPEGFDPDFYKVRKVRERSGKPVVTHMGSREATDLSLFPSSDDDEDMPWE